MTILDWIIILTYLGCMIGLSVYLGRSHKSKTDYYVGGRRIPWWAVGVSTMATQTSAISFISIPAFVALKPGGGLNWLQYGLAVPLATIAVMGFLIPFFRKLELVSVYQYLEQRFNSRVRTLVSAVFLVSRGLATGVAVYASAIVLQVCLGIPLWATILIIGVVTIVYDTIGGMAAVIYSDVIQMIILVGGIFACIYYAADSVGGFAALFNTFPDARIEPFDWSIGVESERGPVPFWAFLIGGFFLYASYYGTDQSQVQRELSAKSEDDTKRALLFNGLARFPLTCLYILMGVSIYAVYVKSPELAALIPSDRSDYLVPQYLSTQLPLGLRALLFAAILAAAMSSLDSALNSLSASTMTDFVEKYYTGTRDHLWLSKVTTVLWGILVTGFAFIVGGIDDTVIEAINKIGSAFYGPILAAFLCGILSTRVQSTGIFAGILGGVAINLFLWVGMPNIHWMWWNMTGFLGTVLISVIVGARDTVLSKEVVEKFTLTTTSFFTRERSSRGFYLILLAHFVFMMAIMLWLS